jgi:hypothetical protein
MANSAEQNAAARQRLLVVTAMMLESLYDRTAVQVLATLKPADMRSGGARVPGTSYELDATVAERAMRELLALAGGHADALLAALARADVAARFAALTGKSPPVLADLYAHCTAEVAAAGSESLPAALRRLYVAAERLFTLTQMRRIDQQCHDWSAQPESLDAMPVQQFVARWVRNTP